MTREPEWDDESQGRAMRLAEYEAGMCNCGCGLPMAVAHDPTLVVKVDTYTCYAGRAVEQVRRKADEDAEKSKRPEGWKDGLHYYAVPFDVPEEETPRRPTTRGGKGG